MLDYFVLEKDGWDPEKDNIYVSKKGSMWLWTALKVSCIQLIQDSLERWNVDLVRACYECMQIEYSRTKNGLIYRKPLLYLYKYCRTKPRRSCYHLQLLFTWWKQLCSISARRMRRGCKSRPSSLEILLVGTKTNENTTEPDIGGPDDKYVGITCHGYWMRKN